MTKTIWGVTALGHDASITVVKGKDILFAGHAERYSKTKYDPKLNQLLVDNALEYDQPDQIAWAGKPFLTKSRELYAGQYNRLFKQSPKQHLAEFNIDAPIEYYLHHKCHAASGFLTSNFDEASILVIDSIGEWNTITIWRGCDDDITLIKKINYPHSLGLLYSAFTQRLGYLPNSDEYIVMGMAAYGKPIYSRQIEEDFINMSDGLRLKQNVHIGIDNYLPEAKPEDLAASIQHIAEKYILQLIEDARRITGSKNLVYAGGVALNCLANRHIKHVFNNVWIMPNPGDAGNSLGAAALASGRLSWKGPYLGTNIEGEYPVEELLIELLKGNPVGVANGKAEFGPRAFGNRSLLADPRKPETKEKVNNIKQREQFRPFAPIVLEEDAHIYFDMQDPSPYMQCVYKVLSDDLPGITHHDGTARVQTVNNKQHPGLYKLLTRWKEETGISVLLNTSLNIKGQPVVNDDIDAVNFNLKYNIEVF